ncbi:membrane protein DedA, SNARE-associated domain [Granulicella rosea]|uniref:Membrane protein DedA, SNARE-associated domain n=1 Tax=Granulicella rosea TaxID=474952 RepID=A0A239LRX1_9BACT|nr:rhodanese-like domain-containing protein [Granulicella rosea]SNT33427.1 membrane protein DedA, SNARE-associated domain [Granulicella rosea]
MDIVGVISHHGYAVVAAVLFLAAIGLPLPTSVVLVASGAAAHRGLSLSVLLPLAWGSAVLGDSLLYLGGRYTGWWLLAGLCRLSVNPESCIFSSAEYFYRRGAKTLLFAKWIPGLAGMAAPLAGSLNMRLGRFFRLDALGVLGYVTAWLAGGYIFHGFIRQIIDWVQGIGHAVLLALAVLLLGYIVSIVVFSLKARKYERIERISVESLRERLQDLSPDRLVIIADVRSHGYYDPGMQRIKNSIRVEPTRLKEELVALREFMAPECEIYLYCSCIRDTTSKRVAHMLQEANCRTQVIEGGLKAWIKSGGELELVPATDVQHLPRFE